VLKPPIEFAVRGLEHLEDYYQVSGHGTDDENPPCSTITRASTS
jgi:hypothetical protein